MQFACSITKVGIDTHSEYLMDYLLLFHGNVVTWTRISDITCNAQFLSCNIRRSKELAVRYKLPFEMSTTLVRSKKRKSVAFINNVGLQEAIKTKHCTVYYRKLIVLCTCTCFWCYWPRLCMYIVKPEHGTNVYLICSSVDTVYRLESLLRAERDVRWDQLATAHGTKELNCHARNDKYLLYIVFVRKLSDMFLLYLYVDNIKMDVKDIEWEGVVQGISWLTDIRSQEGISLRELMTLRHKMT